MNTGELINYNRKLRKMTQRELADYLGLTSTQSISLLEQGKTRPTKKNAKLLAELFEISVEELMNGNDAPYENPYKRNGIYKSQIYNTQKWESLHYEKYTLRFKNGKREKVNEFAKSIGYQSMHEFIMDAIDMYMEHNS